jgi:hypothetical protein
LKSIKLGFVGLALAVAAVPSLLPTPADAVGIVKKEVAGEKFSLNLFGFSQFTLEAGDGVASGKDATDDGLRVGADRVRIGYKIWWGKVFSKLHLDFNRPDVAKSKAGLPEIIKDAQVGYKFDKAAFFTIGMFKTPVGMDFNIPGKHLDITKRGMEKKLVLERSVGAMLSGSDVLGTGLGYASSPPPGRVRSPVAGSAKTTPTPHACATTTARWSMPSSPTGSARTPAAPVATTTRCGTRRSPTT